MYLESRLITQSVAIISLSILGDFLSDIVNCRCAKSQIFSVSVPPYVIIALINYPFSSIWRVTCFVVSTNPNVQRFIMDWASWFRVSVCSWVHLPSLFLLRRSTMGFTLSLYFGINVDAKFNCPNKLCNFSLDLGSSPPNNFYIDFFPN